MSKRTWVWVSRWLTVVLVPGAIVVAAVLFQLRPKPEKKALKNAGALVETVVVRAHEEVVTIHAHGTVTPARRVVVQPEVAGRIVWQPNELVPGGHLAEGEPLTRIDPTDYDLAVRQQKTNVDQASVNLELERSRRQVAEDEWRVLGEDAKATPAGRALALREPQLAAARTAVESAKSAMDRALLNRSKTRIEAPFDALVLERSAEVGQVVSPGTPVATLVATDHFWVQVAVPIEKLSWISVPGVDAPPGGGSPATVSQRVGAEQIRRSGRVVRLLGELDPVGRMARLLVEVEDPLGLRAVPGDGDGESTPPPKGSGKEAGAAPPSRLPLLLGAYVEVAIQSTRRASAVEVPRAAFHEGDEVLVYEDGRLAIYEVVVLMRRKSSVLVSGGIPPGAEVVVSQLSGAVPGMKLRKQSEPSAGQTVLGKR